MAEESAEPQPPPIVTAAQFAATDFESAITGLNDVDSFQLAQEFNKAAFQAKETGNQDAYHVFDFLNAICTIVWTPEDRARVWGPFSSYGTRRSCVPTDFSGEQTEVLTAVVPTVKNAALRSRLADIVWCNNRRKADIAALAVDAYCECVDGLLSGALISQYQEAEMPPIDATKFAMRALQIAHATGKKGALPDRVKLMVRELYNCAAANGKFMAFVETAELGLYYELIDKAEVAKDAEKVGATEDGEKYPMAVKAVWDLAARLYQRLNDHDAQRRCQLASVDQLLLMRNQVGSAGAEASWVMDALQALRHIKDTFEKRETLERELRRLQEASTHEMASIPIELNVKEDRDDAIRVFLMLPLAEALKAFALFCTSPALNDLKKEALASVKNSPLMAMISAVHVDEDGKILSKTEGLSASGGAPTEEWYNYTIDRAESIRRLHVVAALIDPARMTLNGRFSIEERHFEPVIACSPFVPDTQKPLMTLGFTRFFQGDLMSATHLILPQLEPCLRNLLKQTGTPPVKRFDDGTEEDLDLGGMYDRHRLELEKILSPNIAAEIERIFHLRPGPVLRHELAHGKLSAGSCFHPNVVYALWLMFRLCTLFALPNWDNVVVPLLSRLDLKPVE